MKLPQKVLIQTPEARGKELCRDTHGQSPWTLPFGFIRQPAMELLAGDSQVDIIVLYENVDILSRFVGKQMTDELNGTIINFSHSQRIPLVAVLPPGSLETERLEAEGRFVEAGLPVYPSIDRAARAIANVSRFRLRTKL